MIAIYKNNVFHQKRKHINTIYHFIRELVSNGEGNLNPCKPTDELVDIFTKPLEKDVFEFYRGKFGVVTLTET